MSSTPTPELTEAEQWARGHVDLIGKIFAAHGVESRQSMAVLLAEYDRRSARILDLEGRIDGQAWADLEAERDRLIAELERRGTAEQDLLDRADWVGRLWRDWPQARRDGVRALSGHLHRAIEDLAQYVAARSTPGAAATDGGSVKELTKGWADVLDAAVETEDWSLVEEARDDIHGAHGKAWIAELKAPVVSSPGADAPAEPTAAAALLARCAALDRLPATWGGSGPVLSVDEIRRLLRAPAVAGPAVFTCDQSPHPPAQCPRCEPIGDAS